MAHVHCMQACDGWQVLAQTAFCLEMNHEEGGGIARVSLQSAPRNFTPGAFRIQWAPKTSSTPILPHSHQTPYSSTMATVKPAAGVTATVCLASGIPTKGAAETVLADSTACDATKETLKKFRVAVFSSQQVGSPPPCVRALGHRPQDLQRCLLAGATQAKSLGSTGRKLCRPPSPASYAQT